jgi:hypothetical protein
MHRLLARTIECTETQSDRPSRYVRHARTDGKSAYEIEHICADHPERQECEFAAHPSEFAESGNRIGDRLLLPASFIEAIEQFTHTRNRTGDRLLSHESLGDRLRPESFNEALGMFTEHRRWIGGGLIRPKRSNDAFGQFAEDRNRIGGLLIWPKSFNARYRDHPHEMIDHGALRFGKAYELDTGPDHAIRSRPRISHFACDRHIDGGTELEANRNTTTEMHSELTVLPQTEKFDWIGVRKLYPQTQRRDVDDRALPPEIRWLVFDMARTHAKGRYAFCPSPILHGPASQ